MRGRRWFRLRLRAAWPRAAGGSTRRRRSMHPWPGRWLPSLGQRRRRGHPHARSLERCPFVRARRCTAIEATGRVDILVNNAGDWFPSPIDDEAGWTVGWDRNITLNLTSAANLYRKAILHFREHAGGTIVNVTSRSAHRGDDRDHLAYGAAKAGLCSSRSPSYSHCDRRPLYDLAVRPVQREPAVRFSPRRLRRVLRLAGAGGGGSGSAVGYARWGRPRSGWRSLGSGAGVGRPHRSFPG